MAYNSKAIKTDVNAKPIPQYYNPATDEYEVLQGTGGAARQVLYGPDGQPISVADNKLAVRAAELETKIEAVRVLLNALTEEDFATQTTLAQILEKMIANPATEAKQAEILAALGKQSTAEKQDALAGLVGALDAAAVSDPAAAGAVIALLKGVLSRLHTLEGKIDGITTEDGNVKSQLTGSLIADEEAVPVRSPKLTEELVADPVSVTAGATTYVYDSSLEGETVAEVSAGVLADVAHNFVVGVVSVSVSGMSVDAPGYESKGSRTLGVKSFKLTTKRFRMSIKNDDTADHEYTVGLSKIFR